MALLLPRDLPSGVTTTYHRILRANFNFNPPPEYLAEGIEVLVELVVGEYLSQEARLAGKQPVRHEVFTIPANSKSILTDIYRFLGADPAEDLAVINSDALDGIPDTPPPPTYGYEGALPA